MIKTLLLVTTLLYFSLNCFSQKALDNSINPFTVQADIVYSNLNKSDIPTDILYDRVFPYADLREFNRISADTSNTSHYHIAYAELQQADYTKRWDRIHILKNTLKALPGDQIPLGFINVDFNYFDENAIDNNQLTYNSITEKLEDVAGRINNPYLDNRILIASNLRDYTCGLTVSFTTSDAYNMIAATKVIQIIQADFGNGYITIPDNSSVSVTFSNVGLKTIKYKIIYTDNSIQYTHSTLQVNDKNPMISRTTAPVSEPDCTIVNQTIQFESDYTFQGYDESTAYAGMGEYHIYRGGNSLDKPVIVVDGFDPAEGTSEGVGIQQLFGRFNQDFIAEQLLIDNYDIIPLNFLRFTDNGKEINGGTDYIERNAMTLVTLIETINECKDGDSPIKVVGFSMGGLIARYALAYMEANNIPHEADLFISIDSPHKGAVIPIGIQETAELIDDIVPGNLGDLGTDLLDTPAAKQLLVHHYKANSKTPAGAPNFHNRFYNDLNTLGFPQLTRNIAVVNGVSTGANINPIGSEYVDLTVGTGLYYPSGGRIKSKLKYTPDRGLTRDALDFKFQLKFSFVYVTVFKRIRQATTLTATGSYENTPGGFFDVNSLVPEFIGDIDDVFDNWFLRLFVADINIELINPDFSFIPVKSSLAFSGSPDLYEDFSQRNLVCTGETPFNSYITSQSTNEEHIELNNNSANYIFEEILGNPQPPNFDAINSFFLTEEEVICTSNTDILIQNCEGFPVTWNVSSNLQIVNTTPSLLTVRATNNNVSDYGFIEVDYNGETFRKDVWVGVPAQTTYIEGETVLDYLQTYSYYVVSHNQDFGINYKWSAPDEFSWNAPNQNSDNPNFTVTPDTTTDDGNITMEACNRCGTSQIETLAVQVGYQDTEKSQATVYPNPAKGEISVKALNEDYAGNSFTITDFYGNKIIEGTLSTSGDDFNIDRFKAGVYILKVLKKDGSTFTKQILKH